MAIRRPRKVAVIHCAGGSPLRDGVVREDLPHDCNEILTLHPDGITLCAFGCLGGGTCAAACRRDAIVVEGDVARVLRGRCVGCGLCAKACPHHLITLEPAENTIQVRCSNQSKAPQARKECKNSCIGCGICERSCPAGAIHVIDGRAQIDGEQCLACGMCATKCPRGAIHDGRGIFTVE